LWNRTHRFAAYRWPAPGVIGPAGAWHPAARPRTVGPGRALTPGRQSLSGLRGRVPDDTAYVDERAYPERTLAFDAVPPGEIPLGGTRLGGVRRPPRRKARGRPGAGPPAPGGAAPPAQRRHGGRTVPAPRGQRRQLGRRPDAGGRIPRSALRGPGPRLPDPA